MSTSNVGPYQGPAHAQPASDVQQPQYNRKQRRRIEKHVRSEKFRRSMRHVMANRKREALAITQEALDYAANGPLDINLEDGAGVV